MKHKVLFVDDSVELLAAIRRRLRKQLNLTTAESSEDALKAIKEKGPFAVIVTDQNMPGTDGLTLLKEVSKKSPNTIPIMLTGQADKDVALRAINESHVFSLLTKPCSPDGLLQAVNAALETYQAREAEKKLLEQTLAGSVKLLVDILGMQYSDATAPIARMRLWAKKMAPHVDGLEAWQQDIAITLAPVGRVTLPADIQHKLANSQSFSPQEQEVVDQAPSSARELIRNIPRLNDVAEAVYYQNRGYDGSGFPADGERGKDIPVMARVIRLLKDLAKVCDSDMVTEEAFAALRKNNAVYDPALFTTASSVLLDNTGEAGTKTVYEVVSVPPLLLKEGDMLEQDLHSTSGNLILSTGHKLSGPMIQKISQIHKLSGIVEPISVRREQVI